MTTIDSIYQEMQHIAPLALAESWDNPGLLVDCGGEVSRVLVALDVTAETLAEAEQAAQKYVAGTMEGEDGFAYDGAGIYDLQENRWLRVYGNFPDERAIEQAKQAPAAEEQPASPEQADLQPKKEEALPLPPKHPRRERITFTTLHPEVPRDQRHDFHITDDPQREIRGQCCRHPHLEADRS